jgi:hypothetical protein
MSIYVLTEIREYKLAEALIDMNFNLEPKRLQEAEGGRGR